VVRASEFRFSFRRASRPAEPRPVLNRVHEAAQVKESHDRIRNLERATETGGGGATTAKA